MGAVALILCHARAIPLWHVAPFRIVAHRAEEGREARYQFGSHPENCGRSTAATPFVKAGSVKIAVHRPDVGGHMPNPKNAVYQQVGAAPMHLIRHCTP